ncbi:MAG: hypothetical protein P1U77_17735, partial [Rubripirellula sp.]|nr:hypothetical protein [Rubripirellula sp.]
MLIKIGHRSETPYGSKNQRQATTLHWSSTHSFPAIVPKYEIHQERRREPLQNNPINSSIGPIRNASASDSSLGQDRLHC